MKLQEPGIFELMQTLDYYKERDHLQHIFRRIQTYFQVCGDRATDTKESDPMLWFVLAHKFDDLVSILRDGYSESDLIDAGLIDLQKEE